VPDTNRPFTTQKHVNALAIWFEVDFPSPNRVTRLSTSPFHALTHWKQQVVYLPAQFKIFGGSSLRGSFALRKNPQDTRDI
jgi:hypothetical protein